MNRKRLKTRTGEGSNNDDVSNSILRYHSIYYYCYVSQSNKIFVVHIYLQYIWTVIILHIIYHSFHLLLRQGLILFKVAWTTRNSLWLHSIKRCFFESYRASTKRLWKSRLRLLIFSIKTLTLCIAVTKLSKYTLMFALLFFALKIKLKFTEMLDSWRSWIICSNLEAIVHEPGAWLRIIVMPWDWNEGAITVASILR